MNPNFNFDFREFLKSLQEIDDAGEIIRTAQREMRAAKDFSVKRRNNSLLLKQQNYIVDLRDFIGFVSGREQPATTFPEDYLNSDEYKHKLHYRTFGR
jgi:hypothetical protein